MARSISGSAKIRANTNASRPPNAPASNPRRMSLRSMSASLARPTSDLRPRASVAGEADEVPRVVHELVHVRAAEDRGGALLEADEVVRERAADRGGEQPRDRLRDGDDDRGRGG